MGPVGDDKYEYLTSLAKSTNPPQRYDCSDRLLFIVYPATESVMNR
jgi:hypothetical protein